MMLNNVKRNHIREIALNDLNQSIGLTMGPENRWVRLPAILPWEKHEHKRDRIFKGSKEKNVAKQFRLALDSLIIQLKISQFAVLSARPRI